MEEFGDSYIRLKHSIVATAFKKVTCDVKYSNRYILQVQNNEILETIPDLDEERDFSNLDDRRNAVEFLSELELIGYQHINEIVRKLKIEEQYKLVVSDQIKNSKVLGIETLFDERLIDEQDRLLQFLNSEILEQDIEKRSTIILPSDVVDKMYLDFLRSSERHHIHTFTKDLHRYIPKNGLVSFIEVLVIATLANCFRGRAVGTMAKIVPLKKAEEKLKLIKEEIMNEQRDELIKNFCMQAIFDTTGDFYEEATISLQCQMEPYWIYTFPLVQLLIDGKLTSDSILQCENKTWEMIERDYLEVVYYRFQIESNLYIIDKERVLNVNNVKEAIDLYNMIVKFTDEIKSSIKNIITCLPMFQHLLKY